MSDSTTIARPYAEAAYDYASEHGKVEDWRKFLQALALTIENSHIVQTAEVQSMKESCDFITKILSGMFDKNQENFVKLLIENARLKFATDIFNQYQYIADQKQRRFKAEVVSASTLDSAQLAKLKQKLEAKYNGTVELQCSVEPALIGGLIIKVGDEVLDASIRTRLSKLSQSLQS